MSPARPSSRRNSSGSFKPYTRGVTPILVSSLSDSLSAEKSFSSGTATNGIGNNLERPGFPTYAQYKQVENAYLQSLTPRRQGKALISQAMFDRIWDVLHQPESHNETAQFRFWARKMFTVSKTHRVTLGGSPGSSSGDAAEEVPQEVLLHDNLLVAIQEQLYDLLCYCHGSTGHGGRDKTCALIRKHYTWVPKDLVSNFIKACPTCIMKKCGNSESAAVMAQMSESRTEKSGIPLMRDFFPGNANSNGYGQEHAPVPVSMSGVPSSSSTHGLPWPNSGGPRDPMSPPMLEDDALEAAYRDAILRSRGLRSAPPTSANLHFSPSSRETIHGLPMSREVSLYKGIPNGWQFRHPDYASAHAEFMRTKDALSVVDEDNSGRHGGQHHMSHHMANMRRPRIPSIAPLWGPDQFPNHVEYECMDDNSAVGAAGMGGYAEHIHGVPVSGLEYNHHHAVSMPMSMPHGQSQDGGIPAMTMHYLLMAAQSQPSPQQEDVGHGQVHFRDPNHVTYMPEIDPALMDSHSSPHPQSHVHVPTPPLPVHSSVPQEHIDMFRSLPTRYSAGGPEGYVKCEEEENVSHIQKNDNGGHEVGTELGSTTNFPSSSSLKRVWAPHHLRLDIGFPNEKTFQAFLAYRDSLGDGIMTPDSPLAGSTSHVPSHPSALDSADSPSPWKEGNPSPAMSNSHPSPASSASSSSSSGRSQLSVFQLGGGVGMERDIDGESATTTPGSSALTTPVDECGGGIAIAAGSSELSCVGGGGKGSGILVKRLKGDVLEKEMLPSGGLPTKEEIALSDGMEVACGIL